MQDDLQNYFNDSLEINILIKISMANKYIYIHVKINNVQYIFINKNNNRVKINVVINRRFLFIYV